MIGWMHPQSSAATQPQDNTIHHDNSYSNVTAASGVPSSHVVGGPQHQQQQQQSGYNHHGYGGNDNLNSCYYNNSNVRPTGNSSTMSFVPTAATNGYENNYYPSYQHHDHHHPQKHQQQVSTSQYHHPHSDNDYQYVDRNMPNSSNSSSSNNNNNDNRQANNNNMLPPSFPYGYRHHYQHNGPNSATGTIHLTDMVNPYPDVGQMMPPPHHPQPPQQSLMMPPPQQASMYPQYPDFPSQSLSSNRMMRNLAEKMRRDKLNTYISELATLVPMVSNSPKRMDKTSVLRLSATFLRMNHLINGAADRKKKFPDILNSVNWSEVLLDDMDGIMLIVTSLGKIVFITHNVERILGHTQLELFGQSIFSITCPEDHAELRRYLTPNAEDDNINGMRKRRNSSGNNNSASSSSTNDYSKNSHHHHLQRNEYNNHQSLAVHSYSSPNSSNSNSSSCSSSSSSNSSSSSSSSSNCSASSTCSSDCSFVSADRQRRSFYLRLRHRCVARSEQPQYELVHVFGHLHVPKKYDTQGNKQSRKRKEAITSANDIILVAVMKPFREKRVTEVSLIEASRDEYITRHLLDGRIIYCDHRISVVSGYLSEEVSGLSAFNFMHKDDVHWVLIALRQMYWRGESYGSSCYRLKSRTGEFIYMRTHGYLEFNSSSDQYASFICVNTLVSSEEGEQEILNMKTRFSPLIENQIEPGISAIAEKHIHLNKPFTEDSGSVPSTEDPAELKTAIKAMIANIPPVHYGTCKDDDIDDIQNTQFVKAKLMSKSLPPASQYKVNIQIDNERKIDKRVNNAPTIDAAGTAARTAAGTVAGTAGPTTTTINNNNCSNNNNNNNNNNNGGATIASTCSSSSSCTTGGPTTLSPSFDGQQLKSPTRNSPVILMSPSSPTTLQNRPSVLRIAKQPAAAAASAAASVTTPPVTLYMTTTTTKTSDLVTADIDNDDTNVAKIKLLTTSSEEQRPIFVTVDDCNQISSSSFTDVSAMNKLKYALIAAQRSANSSSSISSSSNSNNNNNNNNVSSSNGQKEDEYPDEEKKDNVSSGPMKISLKRCNADAVSSSITVPAKRNALGLLAPPPPPPPPQQQSSSCLSSLNLIQSSPLQSRQQQQPQNRVILLSSALNLPCTISTTNAFDARKTLNPQSNNFPQFTSFEQIDRTMQLIDTFQEKSKTDEVVRLLNSASEDVETSHIRLESCMEMQGAQLSSIKEDLDTVSYTTDGDKVYFHAGLTKLKEQHDKQKQILFTLQQDHHNIQQYNVVDSSIKVNNNIQHQNVGV